MLTRFLRKYHYPDADIQFLEKGFTEGFNIGCQGPLSRKSEANNLLFNVGNETVLWNKLMKEVELKRVAGLFKKIPFENYIQSPIGLVPKAVNSGQTRLIFHLSYKFKTEPSGSLNAHMPPQLCSVSYRDLDYAIKTFLETVEQEKNNDSIQSTHRNMRNKPTIVYSGKTDARSAFRILLLSHES